MTTPGNLLDKHSLNERAAAIRLLAIDVDGTLTDGRIIIGADGELAKAFSVHDGMGMRLLMDAGIAVAIITARQSAIVTQRSRELKLQHVLQGVGDKATALISLAAELDIPMAQTAFMGDDLPDLPAMHVAGLAACVADATGEVQARADWIAPEAGGRGAVRALAEYLLKSRGAWEQAISRFTNEPGAGNQR